MAPCNSSGPSEAPSCHQEAVSLLLWQDGWHTCLWSQTWWLSCSLPCRLLGPVVFSPSPTLPHQSSGLLILLAWLHERPVLVEAGCHGKLAASGPCSPSNLWASEGPPDFPHQQSSLQFRKEGLVHGLEAWAQHHPFPPSLSPSLTKPLA